MTDKKFTDEEIVKALEQCVSIGEGCENCPFYEYTDCDKRLKECFNDLINRKDAEIEKKDIEIDILIRKKNRLRDEIAEQQAEIDRLQKELEAIKDYIYPLPFMTEYDKEVEKAQAEAYKDLAEKLKAKKQRLFSEEDGMLWCVSVADIDEVLKEVSE